MVYYCPETAGEPKLSVADLQRFVMETEIGAYAIWAAPVHPEN